MPTTTGSAELSSATAGPEGVAGVDASPRSPHRRHHSFGSGRVDFVRMGSLPREVPAGCCAPEGCPMIRGLSLPSSCSEGSARRCARDRDVAFRRSRPRVWRSALPALAWFHGARSRPISCLVATSVWGLLSRCRMGGGLGPPKSPPAPMSAEWALVFGRRPQLRTCLSSAKRGGLWR